ncbi:FUSC family protein [Oxalicibacterium faecigallinarum]|uniref:Antibiotic resistance protein n=1 Tax=Oxalicibacterium faecigallinarum TaxID=573741 RepID=A0A8J3AQ68_9BURK|nr:FUSC family protein [Oxalicibacterium faecigallinarum]GGI16785.1 antibiotic resistance protein [Oxalicibacterium faecigallinarum]
MSGPRPSSLHQQASWQRHAWRGIRRMVQDWTDTEGQRWIFVVKTVLAAFLALWIAFRLGFDSPRSAMMTVFIVALPSSGMALEKSIYRLLGTLVGCVVSLAIVGMFPQQPLLLFLTLALWIGLCTSGSAMLRNARSYGFVLAGYTACMITLPAIEAPLHVFDLAVSRATEITVGILCAAFVSDAIFPRHQSDQLVQAVRGLYRNVTQLCHDAMQDTISDTQMERLHLQFAAEVAALESGRAASWFEAGDVRNRSHQLHAFNASAMVALTTFHTLHRLMQRLRAQQNTRVPEMMQPLYDELSQALLVGEQPARNAAEAGTSRVRLAALSQALPQRLAQLRTDFSDMPSLHEDALAMETALELFQRFHAELLQMVTDYHALSGKLSLIPKGQQRKILSYRPSTPPMIALAAGLRSASALLILALAWYALNWPSAVGAVIIAVIFCGLASSSPDPDGLIRQTTVGFTLAVPFAFFCAFFMLNHVEGYLMLILAMLPFLLIGAYLSTWKKIAGIGIGFNLMFAQMIAPENMMRFDVVTFLNDSMAQVLGLILAALMFALILPEHRQGSRRHIASALWEEALHLCVGNKPDLRHHFESRVRDLLNQLNMGIRGTADAATRLTLSQAVTLLEIGHAILDLRDVRAQLTQDDAAGKALDTCIDRLASYFRSQGKDSTEQALSGTQDAGRIVRQSLQQDDADAKGKRLWQRALTDLHMIHASLLDSTLPAADANTEPSDQEQAHAT